MVSKGPFAQSTATLARKSSWVRTLTLLSQGPFRMVADDEDRKAG